MIKKHEVKTYIERLYCDKCGAEMNCKSVVGWVGGSSTFIYGCPYCGEQVEVDKHYPREVKEEED